MIPPVAVVAKAEARAADAPAVSPCLTVLQQRADFLRASRARRQGTAGFLLQARKRSPEEPAQGMRVGYTASKKIGNAVARNRAKRRLREVARMVLPQHGRPGWDYVLVARPGATVSREFSALVADLCGALARVHDAPRKEGTVS